jgi:hypothetical protein
VIVGTPICDWPNGDLGMVDRLVRLRVHRYLGAAWCPEGKLRPGGYLLEGPSLFMTEGLVRALRAFVVPNLA